MMVLGALALALVFWALGGLALTAAGSAPGEVGVPLQLACGLVFMHLLLLGLSLAAVPWSWVALALAALGLAGSTRRQGSRRAVWRPGWSALGWGDGVAVVVLVIVAALALQLWICIPDFVYHWGLKGEKFFLARGIDYDFLRQRSNWRVHPDYPTLLPELFVLTAMALGQFDPGTLQLWSAVFFALLLLVVRRELYRMGASRSGVQATVALLALVLGGFAVGFTMGGAADWLPALALLLAAPALLRPPSTADDLTVGIAAALAAGSKIEGVALGLVLVAVQAARSLRAGAAGRAAALVRLAGPWLAVVLPWLAQNLRYGLFLATNTGAPAWGRSGVILRALGEMLVVREWHGWALAVLLLPWLLRRRDTRALAAVCLLQLGFDLLAYWTAPIDARLLILASFPRLLFQLLPATLFAAAVALCPRRSAAAADV